MAKFKQEIGTQLRILLIQRAIMNSKLGLTVNELSAKFLVSKDSIRRDFRTLATAGFVLKMDDRYRYSFKKEEEFKQLKELLHFSDEEQIILHNAIDQVSPHSKKAQILKKKLASLYDFRKLGHSYLKRPYLQKLDKINNAIQNRTQITLERYSSSNSNIIRDRKVEPFHIDISNDMLFAVDLDVKKVKNFKISRIEHIRLSNATWNNQGLHNIIHTDPFRISSKKMINIHLIITLAGKNELEERFPLTRAFINESEDKGIYEFQCDVNEKFFGVDNFILGFHREIIEIISPDLLIEHLKKDIEKIKNIEGFY